MQAGNFSFISPFYKILMQYFSAKLMKSFFGGICSPPGLLPVLGPCERYMTPTLDAAVLISSRAGTDPGLSSDSRVLMPLLVE